MMLLVFPLLLFFCLALAFSFAGRRFLRRWRNDADEAERRPQEERRPLRWLAPGLTALRTAPDPEARVFRLAYKRRGRITVSDAVIDLGLSIQQAEELLNSLVDDLRVRMEVTPNGLVVYEFPEILARFRKP
jgi:hypothetical protein